MNKCLISILLAALLLASGSLVGCGGGLQTFSKHGISFKVSSDLKLEEYTVRVQDQIFRKGPAGYNEGAVLSTEKNFIFLWLKGPEFTPEEVRLSILSTPSTFSSVDPAFRARITGDLVTQRVADFEVTFAHMQFTFPGGEAPGITAVWYCPASQRTMQLVIIHKQPKREMESFIRSFSCG